MENRQYPPTIIQLVADEPSLDLLGLKSPRCGALVLFEGMTRSTTEEIQTPDQPRSIKISDRSVTGLTYNSYKPMFYKVVQKLVGQTRSKWPSVWGIGVIHRVGKCPLGEAGEISKSAGFMAKYSEIHSLILSNC